MDQAGRDTRTEAPPLDIPAEWRAAARRLVEDGARRVVVLGARDVGKSVFCAVLLGAARAAGRSAHLLDADLGQKMVGPPTCVTCGGMDDAGALRLSRLAFVGALEPLQHRPRLLAGLERLCAACGNDLAVVNTSGFLSGPALRLKTDKIRAARADRLVLIGASPTLERIAGAHAAIATLRLPPAPSARRKGEGERRERRRAAFAAYFAGAPVVSLSVSLLVRDADGTCVPPPAGLLVGTFDAARREALGIVGVEASGTVLLRTPAPPSRIAGLQCGALVLDESFRASRVPPSACPTPR